MYILHYKRAGNTKGVLLFDWFGISCMTTDNFCFYLPNRLIQTKQEINGTVILPPLVFPEKGIFLHNTRLWQFRFTES